MPAVPEEVLVVVAVEVFITDVAFVFRFVSARSELVSSTMSALSHLTGTSFLVLFIGDALAEIVGEFFVKLLGVFLSFKLPRDTLPEFGVDGLPVLGVFS